jgi:hypothetical protein
MKPVDEMTLQRIQAELKAYKPENAYAIVSSAEHTERRAALWRKLDELVPPRNGCPVALRKSSPVNFGRMPA